MGNFVRTYFRRHPVRTQRALEIIPGLFSWGLILFPFWGSLIIPNVVAYYIIAFAIYWLYKSFLLSILAIVSHLKIKAASRFDWISDLKKATVVINTFFWNVKSIDSTVYWNY